MKNHFAKLLLPLLALGLTACPPKTGDTTATACNTSVSGTFAYACYLQSPGVYAIDSLTTNGTSTFSFTSTTYGASSTCAGTGTAGTVSGTLSVGSASSVVSGATNVDITPTNGGTVGCGANTIQYSIYKFNSSCQLVFGEPVGAATGCGSAANRHANLSSSQAFTRQ